jgi:hypothetical protein
MVINVYRQKKRENNLTNIEFQLDIGENGSLCHVNEETYMYYVIL